MSIIAIICLSAIVGAFVLFAVVLAWGEHQTRDIVHPIRSQSQAPRDTDAGLERLRELAKEASEPIHAA
jgi:hypothetical protein